tara:strand:- start:343 stop:978 length:636 start_codon:yes stop_codon:yes gene_type:complete
MHNGPQLPTPMIDVDKSDTHQYVKWILRPMLAQNPELLYNNDWKEMIEGSIGSDKLLFLDGSNGKFTIINEDHGETMDNMWLSNTYSIQRGMGSDYDVKTDTISTYKPSLGYYNNRWSAFDSYHDDNIIQMDTWKNKQTKKAKQEKQVDLCDDNMPYNLADLVGLSRGDINEVVYHNPTGTAEMLGDLITADEGDMYDAIDELIDRKTDGK